MRGKANIKEVEIVLETDCRTAAHEGMWLDFSVPSSCPHSSVGSAENRQNPVDSQSPSWR